MEQSDFESTETAFSDVAKETLDMDEVNAAFVAHAQKVAREINRKNIETKVGFGVCRGSKPDKL